MTKTRIIEVPISYVYQLIPPKKRNPVDFNIIENVPVTIPDLTPAEAPAGMRFKPLSSYWSGKEPVDHPWFGGRLYAPFGRAASGKSSLTLQVDDMLELMKNRKSDGYYVPFDMPRQLWDRDQPYIDIKALPPGRTHNDGSAERAQKIAKAQARAAEMIFVDGGVYVACEQPVYQLGYNSSWGNYKVGPDESLSYLKTIPASEIKAHQGRDSLYRVDRLDVALSHIRGVDERNGHKTPDNLSEVVWNQVEVLIPEAVQWHFDGRPRMDLAIDSVFDDLKRHLPEAGLPFMQAFVTFRRLREQQPRDYDRIATFFENELIPAMVAEKMATDGTRRAVSEWVSREDPDAAPVNLAALAVG